METQNQGLTVYQPNAAVVLAQPVDDTGLSDVAGLSPSNLILVQNTTRNPGTARPGQLLDTLSMEVHDKLTVVPLKVMKQRVLFPPGTDLDAEPICRSSNGIVPSPFVRAPQSNNCKTCPHSQWSGDKKPACAEKLRLLVVTKETGIPYFINVGGKSIATCKTALKLINRYVAMNQANIEKKGEGSPLHLYDFFFTISGEVVNGKFRFAVMRFDDIKRVATVGDFGPLFEEFVVRRRLEAEAEQAVVAEAAADAAVAGTVDAEFVQDV